MSKAFHNSIDENNKTFCQYIVSHFTRNSSTVPKTLNANPLAFSKSNDNKLNLPNNNKKLYAQASKISIKDIIHIKDVFPTISPKKIIEINNIINKSGIVKLKTKMTTKEPSRKQVVISISEDNVKIIGSNTNFHINSINKLLKKANLNMIADFIYIEKLSIIITTNQVTSSHNISIIKNILKESENIN